MRRSKRRFYMERITYKHKAEILGSLTVPDPRDVLTLTDSVSPVRLSQQGDKHEGVGVLASSH